MISKIHEIISSHSLSIDDRQAVETILARFEGLYKIDFRGDRFTVHYQFPLLNLENILEAVNSNTNNTNFSLLNRIKNTITIFMERNEQDYFSYPCGWNHYVEDINIQYFEIRHQDSAYRHR